MSTTTPRTERRPAKPPGAGITWRSGRVLADGSRRGAGWVRRMTVGFNIATARLGTVTTVWTATPGGFQQQRQLPLERAGGSE